MTKATAKAMMTCVLCKPFKIGEVTHDEGELVHLDSELADALTNAGVVREATEDDLYDEGEEEGAEAEEGDEQPEMMNDAVRRLAANAEATVTKAVQEVTDRLVKASRVKPSISSPHVAGSDEWRTGGFKDIGEFAHARITASKGDYTAAKKVKRWDAMRAKFSPPAMGAGASGAGSDLVPIEWAENLWRLSFKNVPDLLGMMTKYNMQYQQEKIPAWVQSSAASAVQANVIAEGSAITATTGVTTTVTLDLVKAAVLVNITDELERFTPYHIGSTIEQVAPERIRFLCNDSVVNGSNNGVNLVNNAATVTVIAQQPGRINYNDVTAMEAALFDDFDGDDSVWLTNKGNLPELYSIGYPNRSSTTPIPAWTPGGFNDMLGPKPKGTLLGRPVYTLENVPAVGSRGSLILCNLKSLAAGYTGLIADKTPFLYFNQAIGTWRFLFYFNSVNPNTTFYTRQFGGTASNIVTLSAGSTSSS